MEMIHGEPKCEAHDGLLQRFRSVTANFVQRFQIE